MKKIAIFFIVFVLMLQTSFSMNFDEENNQEREKSLKVPLARNDCLEHPLQDPVSQNGVIILQGENYDKNLEKFMKDLFIDSLKSTLPFRGICEKSIYSTRKDKCIVGVEIASNFLSLICAGALFPFDFDFWETNMGVTSSGSAILSLIGTVPLFLLLSKGVSTTVGKIMQSFFCIKSESIKASACASPGVVFCGIIGGISATLAASGIAYIPQVYFYQEFGNNTAAGNYALVFSIPTLLTQSVLGFWPIIPTVNQCRQVVSEVAYDHCHKKSLSKENRLKVEIKKNLGRLIDAVLSIEEDELERILKNLKEAPILEEQAHQVEQENMLGYSSLDVTRTLEILPIASQTMRRASACEIVLRTFGGIVSLVGSLYIPYFIQDTTSQIITYISPQVDNGTVEFISETSGWTSYVSSALFTVYVTDMLLRRIYKDAENINCSTGCQRPCKCSWGKAGTVLSSTAKETFKVASSAVSTIPRVDISMNYGPSPLYYKYSIVFSVAISRFFSDYWSIGSGFEDVSAVLKKGKIESKKSLIAFFNDLIEKLDILTVHSLEKLREITADNSQRVKHGNDT